MVGVELDADADEPDSLREDDDGHAMHIESEMAGTDRQNDEWRDDATVDCDAAAESAVAQGRDRPECDGDGSCDAVDAGERLVDLEDCVDDDVPLWRVGGDVFHHVSHDIGHDESANGGGDEYCDRGEDEDNEAGEGEAVGRGETAGEAEGSEDDDERADHREGVGEGGDDGEVLELRRCEDVGSGRVDRHGDDAADGARR